MKRKVTVALIIIVLFSGCQSLKDEPFPLELVGVWGTEEPRYEGCLFEIVDNQIIFSNSHEDYIDINSIKGIEKSTEQGETLYVIDFENEEGLEFKASLFYVKTGGREVIHFKNQKNVKWVKKETQTES